MSNFIGGRKLRNDLSKGNRVVYMVFSGGLYHSAPYGSFYFIPGPPRVLGKGDV